MNYQIICELINEKIKELEKQIKIINDEIKLINDDIVNLYTITEDKI